MHPTLIRILHTGKKVLMITGIVLGTVLLTVTILFFAYKDKIQSLVIREINKQLAIQVEAGEIDVHLLRSFPLVSIDIRNVVTHHPDHPSRGQTLLRAGLLSLRFNIRDLINGRYILQKVKIYDAEAHICIFPDGTDNYHIWKETDPAGSVSFSVDIQEVILQGVDLSWQDERTGELYALRANESVFRGRFSDERYTLGLSGRWTIYSIQTEGTVVMEGREADLDLLLDVDNREGIYHFTKGFLGLGEMKFHVEGSLKTEPFRWLELNIISGEASVKSYLDLLPSEYAKKLVGYEMDGQLTVSIGLKGRLGREGPPDITAGFSLRDGRFTDPSSDLQLKEIRFSGNYNRPSLQDRSIPDELIIKELTAMLGKSNIAGDLKLSDTGSPGIQFQIDIQGPCGDIINLLPSDSVAEAYGSFHLDLQFSGKTGITDSLTVGDFIEGSKRGTLTLNGIGLLFRNSALRYRDFNGRLGIDGNDLIIETLTGYYGESDLSFHGIFRDFLPWVFEGKEVLRVDAGLQSKQILLDEILRENSSTAGHSTYRLNLPERVSCNLEIGIGQLAFSDFQANDISTRVLLRDGELSFSDLNFRSMDGKISADGSLKKNNGNQYRIRGNARLSGVDIRKMFHDLHNFGQNSLVEGNLKGYLDADLYYTSLLSEDLAIDLNSVYALGQLIIESGELIEYTPIYELGRYLDIEELKHIRFSELRNLIEIRSQTIVIPEMVIQSSSVNLSLYGTHTFDNSIDYHINLLLSEVLARKGKKDRQEEFGPVIDDGLGKTRLFILMTGTADDPKFMYDKASLKEKLSKDLQQEKEEIKKVLKDEFGFGKKKKQGSEPEMEQPSKKDKFIIEWEDDTLNSPNPL